MRIRNDQTRRALELASSPLLLLKKAFESFGRLSKCPSYSRARPLKLGSESGGKLLASSLSVCRKKSCNPS